MNLSSFILMQALARHTFRDLEKYLKGPILVHMDRDVDLDIDDLLHNMLPKETCYSTFSDVSSSHIVHFFSNAVLFGKDPQQLFQNIKDHRLWNARGRAIVLLTPGSDVLSWLSAAWSITRAVNIVIAVSTSPPQFFTWFPYKPNECSNVSSITRVYRPDLFPQKIPDNLNNCALTIIADILPPYVIDEEHGLEPRIVTSITNKLNLSMKHHGNFPTDYDIWDVLKDGKPVNALLFIWKNDADLKFGFARAMAETSEWADMTYPHYIDYLKIYVPGPKIASSAQAIFKAFSKTTWLLIAVVFIFFFLISTMIHYFHTRSFSNSFTRVVAINLNLSTKLLPTKSYRILFIFAFVYALHVTTAYQSSLLTFLSSISLGRGMETFGEVMESQYKMVYHVNFQGFIDKMDEQNRLALIRDGRLVKGDLYPWDVADEKIVALAPVAYFDYEIVRNRSLFDQHGMPKVVTLEPIVATMPMCMLFSTYHPLQPIFTRYIALMVEGGLIEHFLAMDQSFVKPIFQSRSSRPFTIQNVEGAFLLFIILDLICVTVFLMEVLWKKLDKVTVNKSKTTLSYRRRIRIDSLGDKIGFETRRKIQNLNHSDIEPLKRPSIHGRVTAIEKRSFWQGEGITSQNLDFYH